MAKTLPKTPDTKETPVKDEALAKALKDFNASWDYCAGSWHDRWSNNYKLYHNERVKRGYDGITDTFVPMTFSTIETLTSALFGTKPKYNFLAPHNKADQKTDILNALLDYYSDKDQWSIKDINTGRNGLTVGTGVNYYFWQNDHPVKINIPVRDFIYDPTGTTWENPHYMGRRFLTSVEDLKTYEVVDFNKKVTTKDPETGEESTTYEMKPKYKNLDSIKEAKQTTSNGQATGTENTDKQEKDLLYGSTLNTKGSDQIEVLEIWYEDRVISVANRQVVIEDTENYYKAKAKANGEEFPQGIMPFAGFRDYVDESLFYAKSEVDFMSDQQELLNDLTNQNVDAVTFVLNPMYTIDPKYAAMVNEVENLPGAVYPVEAGTLVPIPMGNVPQDVSNERLNIKSEMRETTASNEIVKGAAQQGGKTTATEINAQIAGSGQRINLKVTQIEDEYYNREARIIFAMIKLYVTEPMMVRIIGKDGAKWEQFDPKEFQDDYEPRVQLNIAVENKKQEDANSAKELMASFLNDPDINQQELKKLVLAKGFQLDPDEVETLMQVPPPPMPMPGQGAPIDGTTVPPQGAMPPDPMQALPSGQMAQEDMMLPEPGMEQPEIDTDIVAHPDTGEPVNIHELAQ